MSPMPVWGLGKPQQRKVKHIFASCSLPPIFSKTFLLAALAQLHFIPQLEMQVCNMTLPTKFVFYCIFGVIIPNN